ncbi:MAG: RrF2 family transcriptional regulator [Dehalococcoidia bacterium]|nr:MAG: RrF2 family transcriptional regulator [Dehalococcoidia bacterium]
MKLSTRGRYGTRAMLDVALHCSQGPVRLKDIAQRQEVSKKYLEHLISRLETAGLLTSIRGASGGMTLARPASEIKLSEILQALEGPIDLVGCVDNADWCSRSSSCATRDIWMEMGQLLNDFLESITLEDLCRQQREKEEEALAMYYI